MIVCCCMCGRSALDELCITIDYATGTGPLCPRCQEYEGEWSAHDPEEDELVVERNGGYEVTADRESRPEFNGAFR